jgi:hypothetical protein
MHLQYGERERDRERFISQGREMWWESHGIVFQIVENKKK